MAKGFVFAMQLASLAAGAAAVLYAMGMLGDAQRFLELSLP